VGFMPSRLRAREGLGYGFSLYNLYLAFIIQYYLRFAFVHRNPAGYFDRVFFVFINICEI
jgi:hypothetical protein